MGFEAGGEVALDHPAAGDLQGFGVGEAAEHGLADLGGVDAGLTGQGEGFDDALGGQGGGHLVTALRDLAGAGAAHVVDLAAEDLQDRECALEGRRAAARHYAHRTGLCTRVPARNGSVQGVYAFSGKQLVDLYLRGGGDGAHVHVQHTGAKAVDDAVFAEADKLHVGGVGDDRDHHVAGFRNGLRVSGYRSAQRPEFFFRRPAAVVYAHRIAGPEQVGGHGFAHDAEADKSYFFHTIRWDIFCPGAFSYYSASSFSNCMVSTRPISTT